MTSVNVSYVKSAGDPVQARTSGVSGQRLPDVAVTSRHVAETERFWLKVGRSVGPDGCWEWTGCRVRGYGQVQFGGKSQYAHRVAFVLTNGPIPRGKMICHHCDNPGCVRPDPLYVGTAQTNSDDMWARGREGHTLGSVRPDMTRRHVAAIHASGGDTASERSDDQIWSRVIAALDTAEWLVKYSERLAHGDSLPELVA